MYHQQLRQKFRKDHCIKDATNTAHLRVLTVHALLYLISCREELSEICCVRHDFKHHNRPSVDNKYSALFFFTIIVTNVKYNDLLRNNFVF